MAQKPGNEFGRRKTPVATDATAPASKRSGHVALVLMGALAVGGGAYALMPSEKCDPNDAALTSEQRTACQSRRSSSSGGHGYYGGSSRSSYYGGDSSSHSSSIGGSSSNIGIGHTTRGGFGSFGHAIAAHFSGGG
ncbi:hypothetical protein [Mesorhizobium sp.]|uniref:hypothetical protein n=1 Tax=Mesorhizobium sp. TaxID=1871066 RepID=UPI0025E94400|nr:hypothetical protein [Mesorhizobium sp.]